MKRSKYCSECHRGEREHYDHCSKATKSKYVATCQPTRSTPRVFIFVGECRSLTAIRKGWSWKDGRLAAKPLFEALEAMGVKPAAQHFINLFTDPPSNHRGKYTPTVDGDAVTGLRVSPWIKVALGKRVSDELTRQGIAHVALVHPAARGRIRKRARYIAHVKERLQP